MSGLVLVPTPIQDEHPLESVALERLKSDCLSDSVIICVEEHKVARQRWLRWGLPRECIERFVLFNEHTQEKVQAEIMGHLRAGKTAYLLSDCGLPAFCDPGQKLVDACHRTGIKITSTPFPNSIALALALSGFSHQSFVFSGFVPLKDPERENWLRQELKRPETLIMMETPYRLKKLLEELQKLNTDRLLFLGCDLNGADELLLRGTAGQLKQKLGEQEKREFVMVIAPRN